MYGYDGSIQLERILKANLPTGKVAGDHLYFVLQNATDTLGELWANRSDGTLFKVASAIDESTIKSQLNGFRVCTFSNLGNDITYNSEISDIINAMPNNSILLGCNEGSKKYPTDYGVIMIVKLSPYRTRLSYTSYQNNDLYYANYSASGTFTGWKKTADTKKGTISLLNGWTKEFGNLSIAKVGNIVSFNLNLKSGATTVGTNIARLPEGFRPAEGFLEDYICYDSNWNANVGSLWVSPDGYITVPEGNVVYNNRLIINSAFII